MVRIHAGEPNSCLKQYDTKFVGLKQCLIGTSCLTESNFRRGGIQNSIPIFASSARNVIGLNDVDTMTEMDLQKVLKGRWPHLCLRIATAG